MKLTDRGYWVSKIYYYQSLWYWIINAIRYRSLTYFYAANPAMHLGGMLDDKKTEVYQQVDPRYLPTTIVLSDTKELTERLREAGLSFPVMIKPDVGFKGFMVRRIESEAELRASMEEAQGRSMLVQEYLRSPHEYAVMCYRIRSESVSYKISSLVEKHLPAIDGDGVRTIRQLITDDGSAFLDRKSAFRNMRERLDEIPEKGKSVIVDHVGNYARGAQFENLSDRIDEQLTLSINEFFEGIEGINFGRLDLKADSYDELCQGKFKLLEINGAKAEPIHIYDPKMSIMDIIKAIREHWRILLAIVRENKKDVRAVSNIDGIKSLLTLSKMMSK